MKQGKFELRKTNSKREKYGFGMSPPSEKTLTERAEASKEVKIFLETDTVSDKILESLSLVKGMFSRIHKQDQWDWFITFEHLGRVGRKKSIQLSNYLAFIRREIKEGSFVSTSLYDTGHRDKLIEILGRYPVGNNPETEQIYILSTRENRDILKIGFTTRSVFERVNEINSATGVLTPFGVRAVWTVRNAQRCEQELHSLFSEYRIRKDREFFNLDFKDAFRRINQFLSEKRNLEEL